MGHRMKIISSTVVMLGLAGVIAGCGSSTQAAQKPASDSPQSGGTITYALPPQTNLNWFIPVTTASFDSTYNFQLIDMLYKPLLWINANDQIDWQSSVASSVTSNHAGTVYRVTLNKKWRWSNGQPVTAQDVLFTWDVIKAASATNAPSPWPYVNAGTGDIPSGVQSVVANNPYELTITLKKPANQDWFIYNGLSQLVPMPAQQWDIHKNMTRELKYLGQSGTGPSLDTVVDGPFKLEKSVSNQEWVLVPNKKYSGHKARVNRLVFVYEGSNAAEFAALKTGNVNVGYLDASEYGARSRLTSQGDVITPQYLFAIFYTGLNMEPGSTTYKIFDNLYVRQAMQMGINQPAVDKDIYNGYAPPISGPIPSIPKTKFWDPSVGTPYPYNPAKGLKLMEKHGWSLKDGVLTRGSQQMKFNMIYASGSDASTEEAELMQEGWQKEGISVSLRGLPFSSLPGIINPKTPKAWQIFTGIGEVYSGYPSGGQLFATNAPLGYGYSNQEEDSLIKAIHTPYATEAQTLAVFDKYEKYTADQLPFLWNNNLGSLAVHLPNVHGTVKFSNEATGIPQFNYWWVSSN